VIIVPPPRIIVQPVPQSQPPSVVIPYLAALPPERPRVAPPKPRCYAGGQICALEGPNPPGGSCACETASGPVNGRALIPPSRRIGGKG
jgi:hypothetical protein